MLYCCPTCRHIFNIFRLKRDILRNTRILHYFSSRVPLLKTPFFIRDVILDKAHSLHRPPFFLITVIETFLDAESREEQDGRKYFLMGATVA